MGRGQRHSKNMCSSAQYSVAELKKAGYGTQKRRLDSDSMKPFDHCWICLHGLKSPVSTPEGYLYCKECILESLLSQKKKYDRELKAYEAQLIRLQGETSAAAQEAQLMDLAAFERMECGLKSVSRNSSTAQNNFNDSKSIRLPHAADAESRSLLEQKAMHERRAEQSRLAAGLSAGSVSSGPSFLSSTNSLIKKSGAFLHQSSSAKSSSSSSSLSSSGMSNGSEVSNFWITQNTPSASAATVAKPVKLTVCPMTKKPLRLKDLIRVEFTETAESKIQDEHHVHSDRFICPLCSKTLKNGMKIALLKETGGVFCDDCTTKLILPELKCPLTNTPIEKNSIIRLQTGGTGYAAGGGAEKAVAKRYEIPLQ